MSTQQEPQVFDVRGGATYSGFSERYLRRLIFERRIPVVRTGGRVWLAKRDLDAYIAESRVEASL